MSRYIDADALIKRLQDDIVCLSKDSEECKQFIIEHIGREWYTPTADVAPVADTVREMQKRLKANKIHRDGMSFRVVDFNTIDQIAKEMLEGNNDS